MNNFPFRMTSRISQLRKHTAVGMPPVRLIKAPALAPTEATYSITPTSFFVNEGSSSIFNVITTNVLDGTTLYWITIGNSNNLDFVDNQLSGTTIINNNTSSIVRAISSDQSTEGPEQFLLQLRTDSVTGLVVATSDVVTINDLITAPTYALSSNINPVDEGISITFTLTTTNVENGNNVPYTISGISQSDIGGVSLNGNFVVDNNNATLTLNISADNLTEGTEYLTLVSGGQTIIVNINDLSKSPVTINFNVYTDIDYGVFPEGNYIIKYVGGAWSRFNRGGDSRFRWGEVTIKAGTLEYFFTDGVDYSMAGAIAAGQGKEMTFYHNGGNIKLLLYDTPTTDNRMSSGGMTYSIWYYIH